MLQDCPLLPSILFCNVALFPLPVFTTAIPAYLQGTLHYTFSFVSEFSRVHRARLGSEYGCYCSWCLQNEFLLSSSLRVAFQTNLDFSNRLIVYEVSVYALPSHLSRSFFLWLFYFFCLYSLICVYFLLSFSSLPVCFLSRTF
jgi:hypothetical protein